MKKINENTKVTLTLDQLKRLVKESRNLVNEREEVSVVTPSGEHLGMMDDEGNFVPDAYPSDRFDCGEYVDDDGEYARQCGKFEERYGYDTSKKPERKKRGSVEYFVKGPRNEEFAKIAKSYMSAFSDFRASKTIRNMRGDPEKAKVLADAREKFKEELRSAGEFYKGIPDGAWDIRWKLNYDKTAMFLVINRKNGNATLIDMYGRKCEHWADSEHTGKYALQQWADTSEVE